MIPPSHGSAIVIALCSWAPRKNWESWKFTHEFLIVSAWKCLPPTHILLVGTSHRGLPNGRGLRIFLCPGKVENSDIHECYQSPLLWVKLYHIFITAWFFIFKMMTFFIVKMGSFFAVFPSSFAHTALSLWNTLQDYYYVWNEHILINAEIISNFFSLLLISILSLHVPCGGLSCKPFLSWKMCYSH